MSANRLRAGWGLLTVALGACGSAGDDATATDRGAGRTIMTIDLESEANADVGPVADGLVLDDGGVVLLASEPPFLHVFGPDGALRRSGARKGQGPGELWFPRQLARCGGDSLFVWEQARQRIAVFDDTLGFVRTFEVPGSPLSFACSERGQLVTVDIPRQEQGESPMGPARQPTTLRRTDTRGEPLTGELVVPYAAPHPLSARTDVAIGDSVVVIATAESLAFGRYDLTLRHLGDVRVGPWEPREPTQAEYEAAIDALLAELPASQRDELRAFFLREVPKPPSLPPYMQMLFDAPDRIVLLVGSPADSTATALVTTLSGAPPATVPLPFNGQLLDARHGQVLLASGPLLEHARVVVVEVGRP